MITQIHEATVLESPNDLVRGCLLFKLGVRNSKLGKVDNWYAKVGIHLTERHRHLYVTFFEKRRTWEARPRLDDSEKAALNTFECSIGENSDF
jgi:hypothetical protein